MAAKIRGFVSHVHIARGGGSADVIVMPDAARVRLTFLSPLRDDIMAAHKERRAVHLQLEGRAIVSISAALAPL